MRGNWSKIGSQKFLSLGHALNYNKSDNTHNSKREEHDDRDDDGQNEIIVETLEGGE